MKDLFIFLVALLFFILCVVHADIAIENENKYAWQTSLFCLFASTVLLWMTNIGDEEDD